MILPFPEKDAFSYYVLGPVFATDVSEEYFRRQLDVRNMSLSSQVKFMQLLKTIPVIPMTNFGLFARMFYYTCFEKNISFAQFHTLRPSHMKKSSGEVSHSSKQALFQSQDIPSTHGTYLLDSAVFPMWKMEIFFILLLRMIFSARTQAPMYLALCVRQSSASG